MSNNPTREPRIIAAVGCPLCGVAAGEPCRNPIPLPKGMPDNRPQPLYAHKERRQAWVVWKQERGL